MLFRSHRVVVSDPAFAPANGEAFTVHTRWIETGFDNQIPAYTHSADGVIEAPERESVVVEVGGKRVEVTLPAGFGSGGGAPAAAAGPKKRSTKSTKAKGGAGGNALVAPMQGTIVKVAVNEGDTVEAGQLVVVLEAMKMEQPLNAHKAGTVTSLNAEVGAVVTSGSTICDIKD